MSDGSNENAVRATVSDYVEGWFDGDAERMERAHQPPGLLHMRFYSARAFQRAKKGDRAGAADAAVAAALDRNHRAAVAQRQAVDAVSQGCALSRRLRAVLAICAVGAGA